MPGGLGGDLRPHDGGGQPRRRHRQPRSPRRARPLLRAAGAIFFVGASLLEPYRPESTSPEFREVFAGGTQRTPNTDLKVMGTLWALLMLLGVYENTVGSETAFPPLGNGLGGFLTDAFYLTVVLGLLGVSVYILARLLGYIRREVAPEAPAAEGRARPERT